LITEGELKVILDMTHDGVISVDPEGNITLFNKSAERIMGLDSLEVIGHRAVEVIPNSRLHLVLETGEPEYNQSQKIGNTTILTSRLPVKGPDGDVLGAVAIFRDQTEVVELTGKVSDLWKSKNLLEALIESTQDAISVADENGKNIIVNPAYTRLTGMSREAVINKSVTVDIAEGVSMHMQVMKTGKPVRNVRMKVGPLKRDVVVNVAPIYVDKAIVGSVGVIHDISEIISLNEELKSTKKLLRHLKAKYTWDDIIGISESLVEAKEQARRAAETPATVLLRGQSGVGKELFAHAIHNESKRSDASFVRVNCAAFTESLLESELFGYEDGAFTGARKGGKSGIFEEADGGTVFLDEVGELGQSMQSSLLRVLQEKEIVRVGGTTPISVDVRIIAATNADLEANVASEKFRRDLYYRVNVIPIYILPLKERREDIPPLCRHMLFKVNQEFGRRIERISDEALERLQAYDWPGNVRELENVLGRTVLKMKPNEVIVELEHIPTFTDYAEEMPSVSLNYDSPPDIKPLDEALSYAERAAIVRTLKLTGNNRTKTASLLGISLRNLYYKLKKHSID